MPVPDLLCADDIPADLWSLIDAAPMLSLNDPAALTIAPGRLSPVLKERNLQGTAAAAGLWLLAGDLDQSHRISQDLHDADGSYWHGIMHRMEGDFWNAKYWIRRAANHPVRKQLVAAAQQRICSADDNSAAVAVERLKSALQSADSASESLIDLVERATNKQTECPSTVQVICWWEWQLLFKHCLA